jgi:hypothetical protein
VIAGKNRLRDTKCGVSSGIGLWCALYPLVREWLDNRANQKALADMRLRSARSHRWDALRGWWTDNLTESDCGGIILAL